MPALPAFAPTNPLAFERAHPTRRVTAEIDALWQLTERLTSLTVRPVAALDLIARTAGELTNAEAAAVLLHPGKELVLASRWGALGMPPGYKSPDVRQTLDAAWPMSATMAIRRGTHEIGCLWIGRPTVAFTADEQRVLRTLAAVTSLALASLMGTKPPATPAATVSPPARTVDDARPPPLDRNGMVPETMRLSVFPPSLEQLLHAIDDTAEIDAVVTILQTDPLLSTLVLRAGNSAAAGRARPATTLRDAIVFLGLRRVKTLALARFTRTLVSGRGPLDAFLWEQAVGTAARTRHVLRALEPRGDDEADVLAGLLHPIGAIALATAHPDRYARALRRSIVADRPLDAAERETFGVDAATLTRQLLQAWHVAPSAAIGDDAAGATRRAALDWAAHVSLAANPAWQRLVTEVGGTVTWVAARIAEAGGTLGLDDVRAATIGAESATAVEALRRLLAMPT